MGDRVLMQIVSEAENGPVVYGHWCGHEAPNIIKRFVGRMGGRKGDVSYLTARLLQEAMGDDQGDTGFGVFNSEQRLAADDTHGDAGIVLIDAQTLECECLGGYLQINADGMPALPKSDE